MRKGICKYIVWQIIFIFSATKMLAHSDITTLRADVTRTSHNALMTKDATTSGDFYFQYPDKICMLFNGRKDMLLMNGTTYVMVNKGERNVAKGKMQELFGTLQKVLQAVICQTPLPDMTGNTDIQVSRQGQTIRIVPDLDAKARRRIAFTSFELTLDERNELKTLRINEKGENYVVYHLSDYVLNGSLDTTVFNLN